MYISKFARIQLQWIIGHPTSTTNNLQSEACNVNFGNTSPVREMHDDLDEALVKLQQILANNFTLDGTNNYMILL